MVENIKGNAGYIDYCCANQISRLELLSMATEFGLDVQGCTLCWLDVYGEDKGLKEIQNDLDALKMAMTVGRSKEACVYVKLAGISCVEGSNGEGIKAEQIGRLELLKGVKEDEVGAEDNLEDILVDGQGEGNLVDEENDLHDSGYNINDGDTNVEDGDNVTRQRPEVDIDGQPGEIGSVMVVWSQTMLGLKNSNHVLQ